MTIRPDLLLAHAFPEQRQVYDARDAILYALGLGLGRQPDDLPFLDETQLAVLPSFAITLASPGMWIRDPAFGIDFSRLVHSAQDVTFNAPLPASGEVVGSARVESIADRGAGRGAELVLRREIRDARDGTLHASVR
ncbi:FAS1-like dehydratase domain-containing protein [Sphingomonas sp. CCH9-H8]|nr:MaoC family dehydratase N-terminal domain-containing protein [Sphingomonas sp. CCH9-H8]